MGTNYDPNRSGLQPPPQGWQPQSQPYYQQQQPPSPPVYGYPQSEPPRGYPPQQPQKWYRTNVGIIVLLIIFFPVGLYLMWRYSRWTKNVKLIVTGILALCVLVGGIANAASPTQQSSQVAASTQKPIVGSTQAALPTATLAPTSIPTPQPTYYPPKTAADLHGLAAKGTISAIYEVHSESVGAVGACPQPKREVTVDPSITGQQLAEDLLAYFYGQQLDSPCGSIVFAYHNQAELNDPNSAGYTAGRIMLDVTDSSGAANFDQNGSNLKYTLTLDIGGSLTSKEYVVTY